jgi:hypothetical protein
MVFAASSRNPLRVVSDTAGRVEVLLEGTDRYAGDNYQIEASFDPSFTCATTSTCAKSVIVTAWKRVYVAVNKMFRKGAFIAQNVSACRPPQLCSIPVDNVCLFPTPPFRARLIHAPTTEGNGGTGDAFWEDEVEVESVTTQGSCGGNNVTPGILNLTYGQVIRNGYLPAERIGNVNRPYLADAVGLVTGVRSADYFIEDRSLIDARVAPNDAPIFEAAFTETTWLTDRIVDTDDIHYDGVIPFKAMYLNPTAQGSQPDTQREWTARKWVRHADRIGPERTAFPNHQSLFLATRHDGNQLYGVTQAADGFNDTWLFLETIGSAAVAREALVHELAHQWLVNHRFYRANPTDVTPGGHCDLAFGCGSTDEVRPPCRSDHVGVSMFRRPADLCLMTSTIQSDPHNGNGEVGFHYGIGPNNQPDSEWLRIRQRQEPVPQFENVLPRSPR